MDETGLNYQGTQVAHGQEPESFKTQYTFALDQHLDLNKTYLCNFLMVFQSQPQTKMRYE